MLHHEIKINEFVPLRDQQLDVNEDTELYDERRDSYIFIGGVVHVTTQQKFDYFLHVPDMIDVLSNETVEMALFSGVHVSPAQNDEVAANIVKWILESFPALKVNPHVLITASVVPINLGGHLLRKSIKCIVLKVYPY